MSKLETKEERSPVVDEVPPQEGDQQEQQTQSEEPLEAAETSVKEVAKKDPDHNWKEANKVLKMQQQKIQELEMRLNAPPPQPVVPEKDEFADMDPNDYLPVGKARQMAERIAEKKAEAAAEKMVAKYAQQQRVVEDEARARGKYEDYDYVLNTFAIPLINNDPALAYRIQNSKNPAETAYKLGKLSDAYDEETMKQPTSEKAEKILKNTQRPLSGNAVSKPLKNQAQDFSKMSKQEVWEMSQGYAKKA